MTKRTILAFLFKRLYGIVGGMLTILFAVILFVYLIPPVYRADAKILVERNHSPIMTDRLAPALEMIEVMNAETEIILSRPVMTEVVETLKPYDRPVRDTALRRFFNGIRDWMVQAGLIHGRTPEERWIALLLRTVEVKPATNSNVLKISCSEEDPVWAAKVVNAVVDSYLRHRLQVYAGQGASAFYLAEMESEVAAVDTLRQRLLDFKRRQSVAANEQMQQELVDQLGLQMERVSKLREELTELRGRFDERAAQVVALRSKISGLQQEVEATRVQLQSIEEPLLTVRSIEREIQDRERALESVRKLYEEQRLRESAIVAATNARVISRAETPQVPPYPRLFFIVVGLAGGMVLSFGIALLREYFDHRANDPELVERALGVPVITSIGRFGA